MSVTPAPSQSGAGSEPCLLALALLRGCVGEVVPWGTALPAPQLLVLQVSAHRVLLRPPELMHSLSPEFPVKPTVMGARCSWLGVPLSIPLASFVTVL